MNGKIRRVSVLVSALAFGSGTVWPTPVRAEETRRVEIVRLPREVRHTLDAERGDHEIVSVQWVNQAGKEFYRCTVALPHGERMIRIQPGGALLSVEDIREREVEVFHARPDDWHREREEREHARIVYWADIDAHVHATARDPEHIRFDECPARVQAEFIRESLGERPERVVRFREGDRVIWQAEVFDGPGHVRLVQVSTDGTLLRSGEFTREGRIIAGDWHPRTVDFESLPRDVRRTLDRDFPTARIPYIDVVTRHDHRVYQVQIEEPRHDRILVIHEDGRILADIPGHDLDIRR